MHDALTDDLYSQLEGAALRQMAQQLGKILGHIFGGRQSRAEEVLGQEREHPSQQGGLGGGLLGAVLGRDRVGDVDLSDLAGLGGSTLGGRRA